MALQRPSIIDFIQSLGSSPGITPTTGSNRIYLICDIAETNATGVMTAATIGGVDATIIYQLSNATMNFYMYYIDEAGIQAMSGTGVTRTGASLASSFITTGIVLQYVDQTTPFVNTLDEGFSGSTLNNSGVGSFTLDEIVDGLGIVIAGNSKTTGDWTYNNGYSEYATPGTDGSNMEATVATKATSIVSAGVAATIVNSLAGDKTCCAAVMLQPGDDGASPPSDPGSSLELSKFEGVGDVTIHTVAGGAAVANQSDVAWSETLQNWLAVINSTGSIIRYDTDGSYVATISKSGNSTDDIEGISHWENDEYIFTNELNEVWKAVIDATTTNINLQVGSNQSYVLPPRGVSNRGLEGGVRVGNDVYVVQESDPMKVMKFTMPADKGDLTAYNHATDLPTTEPFDPEVLYAGIILDLASIEHDPDTDNLLLLSERSSIILEVDRATGAIIDRIPITGMTQPEGLCLLYDEFGRRYIMVWGEPNESQIWRVIIIGGSAVSDFDLASSSTGLKSASGTATSSLSISASTSGTAKDILSGVVAASLGLETSSSGVKKGLGNSSSSLDLNVAHTGTKNSLGSSSASTNISGSGTGQKKTGGGANSTLTIGGSAIGTAETSISGSSVVSFGLSSTSAGVKNALGIVTSNLAADSNDTGLKRGIGSNNQNLDISSTASGVEGSSASGAAASTLLVDINSAGFKATFGVASSNLGLSSLSNGFKTANHSDVVNFDVSINANGTKQANGTSQLTLEINSGSVGLQLALPDLDSELLEIYSSTQFYKVRSSEYVFEIDSSTQKFTIK